jgi:hypothetical protein
MSKSKLAVLLVAVAITSLLGGFVGSRIDSVLAGKDGADSIVREPATKADSIVKEPATKADSIVKEPATKPDSIVGLEKGTENPEGSILAENYNFGIVFPTGSSSHPSTHGIAVFETKPGPTGQERYLLLQIEDAPELAKSILSVSIDSTIVGSFSINAQGYGTMRLEKKEGEPFVKVHDGSILEIKAADNSIVASGSFGAQ